MPTWVGILCRCCNNCCTLCTGKRCNQGVTFGGSLTGGSPAAGTTSGWTNPWAGVRLADTIDVGGSENALINTCVFTQTLTDIYVFDEEYGDVGLIVIPQVTIYTGATSGHRFAVFYADFATPFSGGAWLTGETDLGPAELQDCSALSISIPLTFHAGTADVSDDFTPPTSFSITASHDA